MVRAGRRALAIVVVGFVGTAVARGPGSYLRLRGRVVTDDVIVSHGRTYVPASLLAKALRLQVRETGDGCDLVGVEGVSDDLGRPMQRDDLRLEVIDVARTPGYRARYGYHDFPVAAGKGNEIFVVTCRLGNGTGWPQSLDPNDGPDTLLSDVRFHSFSPLRGEGKKVQGGMMSILSGDIADFALKFEVPVGFRPDRVVISFQTVPGRPPTDFRVSLSGR